MKFNDVSLFISQWNTAKFINIYLKKLITKLIFVCLQVRNGHIKRITDNDIHSQVLEVEGTNVRWAVIPDLRSARSSRSSVSVCKCIYSASCSTTYITCPADPKKTLGIKLPFLVMIIKNLKKYFTFEVQVGGILTDTDSSIDLLNSHNVCLYAWYSSE